MATALTWPSIAKIVNKTIWCESITYGYISPLSRRGGFAPKAEFWRAELDIAPMRLDDAVAYQAFLHQLRGRTGYLLLNPDTGLYDNGINDSGTVKVNANAQRSAISVEGLSANLSIPAGTILSLGTLGSNNYQAVEVSDDATVSGAGEVTVNVQPRLRRTYVASTAVKVGNTAVLFRLADDNQAAVDFGVSANLHTIELVEGIL